MPYIISVILNILTSGLPCCLLALGIFITYRLLDFADLTAEGSFLIGASLAIALIKVGVNPYVATLIATLGGSICGYLTSVFYTKLKIPKLLSGIITMTMTTSLALLILGITKGGTFFTNNVALSSSDPTIYSIFYFNATTLRPLIKTIIMLVIVMIVFVIIYFFFGTEYGMAIRATGMNEKMGKAQGINTERASVIALTLSNTLIALAGAMYAQDLKSCDIKISSGFLVIGLASILIGEAIFGNRSFKNRLISIALGSIVYFVIVNVAIELGFPSELKNLLYAILIVIALMLGLIKSLKKRKVIKYAQAS
ncbi:MAG: ABC transporter permease [Bacilli bacterium]|nr:ABC transporter permease [Bacilli bacterium]